ncbi:MAG: hypothetical protein IPK02_04055 [Candidatus Accumulibacter sp.]|uniref:Uncharacterized protein n=1 Tax=Candidatus Accumulibacter affinis TaxID=2954384 RepID=A0A935T942_9PROT|nr:hypothetical protein [Candidatus Accumulibacter affinis]
MKFVAAITVSKRFCVLRQCRQLFAERCQCIGGLDGARLAGQKWPAHFRETLKVGNHGFEQLIQQAVEGLRRFCFGQERFDVFKLALETRGEFADRFFATGSPRRYSGAATTLDGLYHTAGILQLASDNLVEPLGRLVDQQQVNALALQLVVVVQTAGVNQGDITLAVLGSVHPMLWRPEAKVESARILERLAGK